MYYKVMKDGKVIDVLDKIVYLKYQKKHNIMLLSSIAEAEAFLSSDESHIWHEESLLPLPVDGYDTVELIEIDIYEYERLKALNYQSVEEIQENFLMELIESGVL